MLRTSTRRAIALALGLAVWVSAHAQMAIPGQFAVTPVGSASYSIPIQVPPGVGDMQPRLALSYDSHQGNGMLGVGWKLAGLSQITRCPRTKAQDSFRGSVNNDAGDRFCLDGRRLMVVSGIYGAADSEYRTELEVFSKITARGQAAGGGPASFEVRTRDGLIMEFGGTANSRIVAYGRNPAVMRTWAVNKISDVHGNTQTILYIQPDPGTYYPERIDYTSNSITGLASASRVEFGYSDTRPDAISGYQGGYPWQISRLLTSITTRTGGGIVSTYTPAYDTSTGTARMTSLSLCAPDGACAPATSMRFPSARLPVFSKTTSVESDVRTGAWLALDVDGDGRTDLIHLTSVAGEVRVWRSKGDGRFDVTRFTSTIDTPLLDGTWRIIDVNGDGRSDLVHMVKSPGLTGAVTPNYKAIRVWKSNGDGTFTVTLFSSDLDPRPYYALSFPTDLADFHKWQVADLNGDGLDDLVHHRAVEGPFWRQTYVWLSNGDGTFTVSKLASSTSEGRMGGDRSWKVLDLDGDGRQDLVQILPSNAGMRLWRSNGDGTFTLSTYSTSADPDLSSGSWEVLDVNSDGLMDLLHMTTGSGDLRVWVNQGNGSFAVSAFTTTADTALTQGLWFTPDLNVDGRRDLLHVTGDGGAYVRWISLGDGRFDVQAGATVDTGSGCGCAHGLEGDFRGDGAGGIVRLANATAPTVKEAWLLGTGTPNLMQSVTNGLGNTFDWEMKRLPELVDGGRYTREVPSDRVAATLTPPLPVVQLLRTNAGMALGQGAVAATRVTSFTYDSARMELDGRGFVGFQWMQSRHNPTGLVTRTYFRQDFPYVGMTSREEQGSGGDSGNGQPMWRNLKVTRHEHDHLASSGGRYFPYPRQIDVQAWDLNGRPLPGSRTVHSLPDEYGNIATTTTTLLQPDGTPTEFSQGVTHTYYNDVANWRLGRVVRSVDSTSGPAVPAPVVPGSGGLPDAPPPGLSKEAHAALTVILDLLLSDD